MQQKSQDLSVGRPQFLREERLPNRSSVGMYQGDTRQYFTFDRRLENNRQSQKIGGNLGVRGLDENDLRRWLPGPCDLPYRRKGQGPEQWSPAHGFSPKP
jgi:hypothetical protein